LKRTIYIAFLLVISTIVAAQKILVVENVRSLKNIKYYQGDEIFVKLPGFEEKILDYIIDMTDSTVVFEKAGEVAFRDILSIYRENRMIQILRRFSLIGGAAYFSLDSFNRLINNDAPVILTETLIISGGIVAFSFALIPFTYRKFNTAGKWHLRTLDMNAFPWPASRGNF